MIAGVRGLNTGKPGHDIARSLWAFKLLAGPATGEEDTASALANSAIATGLLNRRCTTTPTR